MDNGGSHAIRVFGGGIRRRVVIQVVVLIVVVIALCTTSAWFFVFIGRGGIRRSIGLAVLLL